MAALHTVLINLGTVIMEPGVSRLGRPSSREAAAGPAASHPALLSPASCSTVAGQMITLYQFHWSHFVEVRWALISGRSRGRQSTSIPSRETIAATTERDCPVSANRLYVPVIYDDASGTVVAESSAILRYLEATYPLGALSRRGEPASGSGRWLLWLDSTVGLKTGAWLTRRSRSVPATSWTCSFRSCRRPRQQSRPARPALTIACSRSVSVVSTTADRVPSSSNTVCSSQNGGCVAADFWSVTFTAADLTLASLMRSVTVVPFFRDHPHLQSLFAWRCRLLEPARSQSDRESAVRRPGATRLGSGRRELAAASVVRGE
jgi:glutathione S-transferase